MEIFDSEKCSRLLHDYDDSKAELNRLENLYKVYNLPDQEMKRVKCYCEIYYPEDFHKCGKVWDIDITIVKEIIENQIRKLKKKVDNIDNLFKNVTDEIIKWDIKEYLKE